MPGFCPGLVLFAVFLVLAFRCPALGGLGLLSDLSGSSPGSLVFSRVSPPNQCFFGLVGTRLSPSGVVSPSVPGNVVGASVPRNTQPADRILFPIGDCLGISESQGRSLDFPTHVCHLVRLRSSIRAVPAYSLLIPSKQVSGPLCLSGPGVLPVPRNALHRPALASRGRPASLEDCRSLCPRRIGSVLGRAHW